jgi:hypothetical protein
MSSKSECQVARSWVNVGSFHTRLFGVVYFAIASVRKFLGKSSYQMFGVAMEMQQWAPFAPFLNYKKISYSSFNNINVYRSSCKVQDTLVRF